MEIVSSVRQTFKTDTAKYPRLAELAESLADFRHLLTAIRRAILPNGEISDDASPQLKRIRAGIAQSRDKIQKSLESSLALARRARPAKTTSRCATNASSFPCAPPTAALFPA